MTTDNENNSSSIDDETLARVAETLAEQAGTRHERALEHIRNGDLGKAEAALMSGPGDLLAEGAATAAFLSSQLNSVRRERPLPSSPTISSASTTDRAGASAVLLIC